MENIFENTIVINTLLNTKIPCSDVKYIKREKILEHDTWFGQVLWEDNSNYTGGFIGKKKHGFGMYTFPNGYKLECVWLYDKPQLD